MERTSLFFWQMNLLVLLWMKASLATLSAPGSSGEVNALGAIRKALIDPHNVLSSWDPTSVDPCTWTMVSCSDGCISAIELPSLGLSGTLAPEIGYLSNLETVSLQNNAISGPIPAEIGKLQKLKALDLSSNKLTGAIPSTLGDLKNLNYLRLNNNNLSGLLPKSLFNVTALTLVDLSYNNLSGSLPKVSARPFKIVGNPLICGLNSKNNCSAVSPEPPYFPADPLRDQSELGVTKSLRLALALGSSFGSVLFIIIVVGLSLWGRHRHNKQIFFDINDQYDPKVCLGHLKRYSFKELRVATENFSSKNILGRGGFGIVYKGCLQDGTLVAVKRLKDYNAVGGEHQFQTEVELIGLAVHRNLLRLYGFCTKENERLLVYPYMLNGSVAARLRDRDHGKPVLDWARRRRIALGTARGLLYLHEQCDPKIIHRDVKAANILLDEDFEAVVGDFGLAKLLNHEDSHVTTAVRGTVGHIAPEYLSTGQSSEKTDVFGFGVLLLELITGQRALDFGRQANHKGAMLEWVKKLHQEGKLNLMVDKDLKNDFDRVELEEMAQVALLCTQFHPCQRPKMSEVARMLEGDGLAEKWEASQEAETPRFRPSEITPPREFIEETLHVIEAMELSGPR